MKRKGRISVDRTRQVLKMKEAGYSINSISRSLKMCTKTVSKIVDKSILSPPKVRDQEVVLREVELGNAKPSLDLGFEIPAWLKALDWEFLVKERLKGVPFKILYEAWS